MLSTRLTFFFLALSSSHFETAFAHAYVKSWSADGGTVEAAQKRPLEQTAFRGVSQNTGWIGSKFIESAAITCGAHQTPKGMVSAPVEPYFHTADQSAKKSLSVKAGGKIELLLAGEPGKGFPHPNGHVQTYLGYCGDGADGCADFDASKAAYFKIQAEMNAIADKLRPNFDSSADGNRWEVPIPSFVPPGSYLMRLELITFGQSSEAEGKQDQYYVYCGQIFVTGSKTPTTALSEFESVHFPGAYHAGNIDKNTLPGPSVVSSSKTVGKAQNQESKSKTLNPEVDSSSAVPDCAEKCYQTKLTELGTLAPSCKPDQLECICGTKTFSTAYKNCAKDNCKSQEDVEASEKYVEAKCGSHSTGEHVASKSSSPVTAKPSGPVNEKLTACDGTCLKAKTTAHELQHLAPTCSPDDMTCLCRSHKWVCAYVSCATSNCKADSQAAIDEVYTKCGAILSSRSRLPTTDYVPVHEHPSEAEVSKSKYCMKTCFDQGKQLGSCASGNLDCVCKSHAAVCAWAKCSETNCQDNTDTIRLASDAIYEKCGAITNSPVRRQR